MADALAGKRISSITYIAPNENAAEAMRDYLSSQKEFMAAKCYREGPLRLIHYFFSVFTISTFKVSEIISSPLITKFLYVIKAGCM